MKINYIISPHQPALTRNQPIKSPIILKATPKPSRSSDNFTRDTQPVTWGKVRLTGSQCVNRSAAHSHWFNDLSAAGEWSHNNILLWLVLLGPPEGLADMIQARPGATEAPVGPSYWQDPGSCPHAWYDPAKDLWSQTRWGRRITYWDREGRDVTANAFLVERWVKRRSPGD